MPSYTRKCKTCSRPIQMRQMPYGQWVAFEADGSDTPHDCRRAPTRHYSVVRGPSSSASAPKRPADPKAIFDDLDFLDVTAPSGPKRTPASSGGRKPKSAPPPTKSADRRGTPPAPLRRLETVKRSAGVLTRGGTTRSLIVSPHGGGHACSIGEAIRRAAAGTHVVVRPGIYREALVLDRPIELVAERPGTVVVEMPRETCLRLTAGARVQGITFRVSERQATNYDPAVEILAGRPVLEECEMTSLAGAGILILNKASDPVIRGCTIRDCQGAGVMVDKDSRGTLKENDISGNEGPGVWITLGADPVLRHNRIHGGQGVGVLVTLQGRGKLLDNDIYANHGAGLLIKSQGFPVVQDTKIRDGGVDGVVVKQGGRGTIEGCDVSGNVGSGLVILDTATPDVRNCRINRNKSAGVWLSGGFGSVRDCDLTGNARGAIMSVGSVSVQLSGNRE